MSNMIKSRPLLAQITIFPSCPVDLQPNIDRKQLAIYCQESIANSL